MSRKKGRSKKSAQIPEPVAIYGGLDVLRGEEEVLDRLAGSPRLVALGVFRLAPDVLAFPESATGEVEKALAAIQIVPGRM